VYAVCLGYFIFVTQFAKTKKSYLKETTTPLIMGKFAPVLVKNPD